MKPEVKLIYSSMLTRKNYSEGRPVTDYILKVVKKHEHVLDITKTEMENAKLLLGALTGE